MAQPHVAADLPLRWSFAEPANSPARVREHRAERHARVREIVDAAARTQDCGAVTDADAFFAALREKLRVYRYVTRETWDAALGTTVLMVVPESE
jgi:hypothetical protein